MKILHTVEFYYPSVGGSQEVVRQLSERLVRLGHEVTVATTALPERTELEHNGVKIVEFAIKGNAVHGFEGDRAAYQRFLVESDFDVMLNYAAQQWATDLVYDVIDDISAVKVLVPCGYSGLPIPAYKQYFERMPELLAKYDASVYLSNMFRDITFAREHGLTNLVVIPNGADADEFEIEDLPDIRRELGIAPDSRIILTIGSHTGMKGHADAMKIFRRSGLRDTTLLLVANDVAGGCAAACHRRAWLYRHDPLMKRRRQSIIVTSLSRLQTIAAYKAAAVFLFPSQVEASPLVLFEAMAAKLPFLTTKVGNVEEIIEWSGGGEVLPTTTDGNGLAHAKLGAAGRQLAELAGDVAKLRDLAAAGHLAWQRRFSWTMIAKEYEKLYQTIKARKS